MCLNSSSWDPFVRQFCTAHEEVLAQLYRELQGQLIASYSGHRFHKVLWLKRQFQKPILTVNFGSTFEAILDCLTCANRKYLSSCEVIVLCKKSICGTYLFPFCFNVRSETTAGWGFPAVLILHMLFFQFIQPAFSGQSLKGSYNYWILKNSNEP